MTCESTTVALVPPPEPRIVDAVRCPEGPYPTQEQHSKNYDLRDAMMYAALMEFGYGECFLDSMQRNRKTHDERVILYGSKVIRPDTNLLTTRPI